MLGHDPRENTSKVNGGQKSQPTFRELFTDVLVAMLEWLKSHVCRPAIEEHGLYTRQQVIHNLKISPNTLAAWQTAGLRGFCRESKQIYFLGRHLIRFLEGEPVTESPE